VFAQLFKPFVAKIAATACSLFGNFVVLRLFSIYLTPAEFGLFVVASQALTYIPYMDGGVRTASNCRLLAEPNASERLHLVNFSKKFYSWFALAALAGICVVMLLYWLTPNVRASGEPLSFFLIFGATGAVLVSAGIQALLLIGLGAQNGYYWIQAVVTMANVLVLGLALKSGLRLWAFPLSNAAMALICWPASIYLVRSKVAGFRPFDFHLDAEFWRRLREIRHDAIASFWNQLAMLFLYSVEIVIVGMSTSPAEAAVYALLVRILIIIRSFVQSLGEISWPMLAQSKSDQNRLSHIVLRLTAWMYGSVAGAILVTLVPFLRWYMGPEWTGPNTLLLLLLIRFVIVGVHSPAGYYLQARSEFRVLAKYNWLELAAALGFSALLLPRGGAGIAAGFLFATVFATLFQILRVFARRTGFTLGSVLFAIWSRVIAGFAISALLGWLLILRASGIWSLPVAAVATLAGLSLPLLFRKSLEPPTPTAAPQLDPA
jgi:O-antigen/teichoic acid export membrane protein